MTRTAVRGFLLLAFTTACAGAAAQGLRGTIVAVQDGDTVTLLDGESHRHRIRLAGIDAPEKRQAFGRRARQALVECAAHAEAEALGRKLDRYGRLVAKVVVGGVDCNLNQIRLGLAWHYKKYQREQSQDDRLAYSLAEEEARRQHLGLWTDEAPTAPWDFRSAARSKSSK